MPEQSNIDEARGNPEQAAVPEKSEPVARMMSGKVGTPGLALVTIVIIAILWVVLYGLNGPTGNIPGLAPPNGPAVGSSGSASPTAPQNAPHGHG